VQIEKGQTISIKRHVVFAHEHALGGGFSSAPVYKVSSIELVGGSSSFPRWDAPLVPLVLDKDLATDEWILVASVDGCSVWERNGLPRPPYWAFRLRSGIWYLDEIPSAFLGRPANLFVDFDVGDTSDELSSHVAERKQNQFRSQRHPKNYDSIDKNYDEFDKGCSKEPSSSLGAEVLDLKNFRRLP
jgi:hypothetical protein